MTQATAPTLVHSIDFTDGDHAIIATTAPGHFTLTGQLGGEPIAVKLTAWREDNGTRIDGMPDQIRALPAARYHAVVAPLWRHLVTAELGTTRPAPLEDEQSEDEQADSDRNPCPSWCADRDQPEHWERARGLWQALHARRLGPVTVLLPVEFHDDGMRWAGKCEVTLNNAPHTQQMSGETALTVQETAELAEQLRRASVFASALDERVSELFAEGVYTDGTGEQVAR